MPILCLSCIFWGSGFPHEFGSYTDYFKKVVKKENHSQHQRFLSARKQWVASHRENPGVTRLKNKKDLLAATKQLKAERRVGGQFMKPERNFVTPEAWNPAIHGGEYDKTKEVEEEIFGKVVKGCWVSTGPAGVFRFKEFDEKMIRDIETEHDPDDQLFAEEAYTRKRKAALEAVEASSKARDQIACQGKEMSMASLLQSISSSGAGSSRAAGDAS